MLTVALLQNFAQQKFVRIVDQAREYYVENGVEGKDYLYQLMRLELIVDLLIDAPDVFTYKDLEAICTSIQEIGNFVLAFEAKPFSFVSYINANNYASGSGNSLYPTWGNIKDKPPVFPSDIASVDGLQEKLDFLESRSEPPLFTFTKKVKLSNGKTLGKYVDGDTITYEERSLDFIVGDLAQESIPPTVTLTSPTVVQFNQTVIANVLNLSKSANSLDATIASTSLEYRRNNTGAWMVLDDNPETNSFIHNLTDSPFNTEPFNYRFIVADSFGDTTTVALDITPVAYQDPVIVFDTDTLTRERGDISSNAGFTVTRRSPFVALQSFQLQLSVNGSGWANLGASSALIDGAAATGTQAHNDLSLVDSDTLSYRVIITDTFGATTSPVKTITLIYKSFLGYSTSATLTIAQILGLANGGLDNDKARTFSNVTAAAGEFTFYAYRAGGDDVLSTCIMDNSDSVLGAFSRQVNVSGTNEYGASLTYAIMRSNATKAFTSNTLAFS